jgi:chromosome partitioning protein
VSLTAFLSYAPEDAAAGETVRAWLAAEQVAVTRGSPSPAGGPLSQTTLQTLGVARAVVVLLSQAAEADDHVRREMLYALGNGRPIIPVQLGDLNAEGWMRHLLENERRVDARPILRETAQPAITQAVKAALSDGRVIAMLNIKGGVGKTVLAANLFAAAHLLNHRSIAFIDLDPQHNLTQFFLPATERNRRRDANETLYSVFATKGPASIPKAKFARLAAPLNRGRAANKPRLDLVLGDERLFEYTLDMISPRDKEESFARFHALIASLRAQYDAVVIDTNPCATFLTRCAVTAADHIVAPVRPEKYSLMGLNLLEQITRMIRQRPVAPEEFSVLLNGFGERSRMTGGDIDIHTRQEIESAPFFGSALLPMAIPFSVMLRAPLADRYAANPVNTTAIMRFSQRALKETLTSAVAAIFARADAVPPMPAQPAAPQPVPVDHAPVVAQDA